MANKGTGSGSIPIFKYKQFVKDFCQRFGVPKTLEVEEIVKLILEDNAIGGPSSTKVPVNPHRLAQTIASTLAFQKH